MKKLCCVLISICLLFIWMLAYAEGDVSISFDSEYYSLAVGKSITLKATVKPRGNTKLEWTSSNEEVATVSKNGAVKGISAGDTVITVTAVDNTEISASCTVSVILPVKKIMINEGKQLTMPIEETQRLGIHIEPEDATNKEIEWSSSNEKIVTVDQTGLITAVGKGSAKITASSTDGSKVKGTVNVKVDQFDYVLRTMSAQQITLYTNHYGGENVKFKTQNQNVEVSFYGIGTMIDGTGIHYETMFEITPKKVGSDVITFRYGSSSVKYTVYVTPEAVDYSFLNDDVSASDTGETREILFLGIPWGSSYPEAKELLKDKKIELKSLAQTNNDLRAMLDKDIEFSDCTAFKAAMNFLYDKNEADFKEVNRFYKGDFYFETKFSFAQVQQAVMSVYGLDQGKSSQDKCIWEKDGIQFVLTKKERYIILEIIKDLSEVKEETNKSTQQKALEFTM